MRRFTTAITAAGLALSLALSLNGGSALALTPGYDSAYQFESAFLTLKPGDSGTFSVFFANTGTTSWTKGAGTQVNLSVCAADKVTCNVTSANAAWAVNWLSSTAYATATKSVVVPGDFSAFTYNIKAPAGTAAGTFRFNGDLVLASTGDRIHPEGYFQDATIAAAAAPAISASPDFAVDSANQASTAVPGTGQHTVTFTTSGLTGTLSFVILDSGNVNRNADGTFGFCDTGQNSKATIRTDTSVAFVAVNGRSITSTNTIINEPIPTNGISTVTIDSATRNRRVRVAAWQDLNNNGGIDLVGPGDVNCDNFTAYSTSDGAIAVSGRKFFTGPQGTFGQQTFAGLTCFPTFRHSGQLQMFTAGDTSATSLRFNYDSNDIFRILGVQVTLAQWKASLRALGDGSGDKVSITYNPDPAGISEFNICQKTGFIAPSDLSAATGNFDSGSTADDVRLTFTAPASNATTAYNVQRSGPTATGNFTGANAGNCSNPGAPTTTPSSTPGDGTFSTVGSVSVDGGKQGTFTNFDLATGSWCFRVFTQDPTTAGKSFSNYIGVDIPGTPDLTPPTSTTAQITSKAGLANTLGSGDKLEIFFSKQMSVAANAVVRVTDSDCESAGNRWTSSGGPPTCSGGLTNTVADIICGTNATCALSTPTGGITNSKLTLTLTANPTIVAAGSVAGVQLRAGVTDSSGITDLSGNTWALSTSPDRVFCAVGDSNVPAGPCP